MIASFLKKFFLIFFLCLTTTALLGQEKLITKKGVTTFEASVRSFEEVKATSKNTTAVIETTNGNFAVLIPVQSFTFKNALMQEHFNENYIESDKFPKAAFAGTIINLTPDAIKESPTAFVIEGNLTLHGQTKKISTPISLKKEDRQLLLHATFEVTAADFDIAIPKIITKKIAADITINVSLAFEQ